MDALASDSLSDMRDILEQYAELIALSIASTTGLPNSCKPKREYDELVVSVVGMMAQSAGSLVYDTLRYKQPGFETRTCFILARSIVETMINCCFVLADGRQVAELAIRHAQQKAYRDWSRESQIGSFTLRMPPVQLPEAEDVPGLSENLSAFTTKKGKEIGQWTALSVPDRIKNVAEKLGDGPANKLHAAYFAIYRYSSEIIHGSFYGAAYSVGFLDRRPTDHTDESIFEHMANQHWMVLFANILAIDAFIVSLHKVYGLAELCDKAKVLVERVKKNPVYATIGGGRATARDEQDD